MPPPGWGAHPGEAPGPVLADRTGPDPSCYFFMAKVSEFQNGPARVALSSIPV